jgi:hypothetical protein
MAGRMTKTRRRSQRRPDKETARWEKLRAMLGLSDGPRGYMGLVPPPVRPFHTSADRMCAGCATVRPGDLFDGPVTPGNPRANRCRRCVAGGKEPQPKHILDRANALHAARSSPLAGNKQLRGLV